MVFMMSYVVRLVMLDSWRWGVVHGVARLQRVRERRNQAVIISNKYWCKV